MAIFNSYVTNYQRVYTYIYYRSGRRGCPGKPMVPIPTRSPSNTHEVAVGLFQVFHQVVAVNPLHSLVRLQGRPKSPVATGQMEGEKKVHMHVTCATGCNVSWHRHRPEKEKNKSRGVRKAKSVLCTCTAFNAPGQRWNLQSFPPANLARNSLPPSEVVVHLPRPVRSPVELEGLVLHFAERHT